MKKDISCKLLIIGAGPGGYVCGIRAGQLGLDTVLVDAGKAGGTCLHVGCIPSKSLIHAAEEFHRSHELASANPFGITQAAPSIDLGKTIDWKDSIVTRLHNGVIGLLKKANVKMVRGQARFLDGKTVSVETDTGQQVISAETIVIATGSSPMELPFLPFGGKVISSTGALALRQVPEKLVVVGGGYIGLELGTAFAKLGSKVTVVEAAERILPQYDSELTAPVAARLKELGVRILTSTKAQGLKGSNDALHIEGPKGAEELQADKILVTVGRKPVTANLGLEELVLDMDGPFIRINNHCETAMRNIYAIGDVTGEPMLAHRAMAQGEMVAEIVAGHRRIWDKQVIPAVCFTDPEIVTVGLSPDAARAAHSVEIKTGVFPFAANGRAMTMLAERGFVRVVARADNHLLLGIQAVGEGVSELSAGFAQAIEMGARLEDIAGTIHAHPTLSEGVQEAALKALGRTIHI
ncbi:dihydrolipoyl dehydrogenase [Microvirga sp. W0021]|uniref:Dihydrolipoyl dehydrogenase n=1 Tax=Hohaiivirga grylli TaxID=3133970 RepID=A0ABV0BGG5_9HYPH